MDKLEIAVNDVRTELQFFRIALQVFYLNVASRSEAPLDMLLEMKRDVMQAVEKLVVEPQTAQGDQRMKQMTKMHGENFFAHLETHMKAVLRERLANPRAN